LSAKSWSGDPIPGIGSSLPNMCGDDLPILLLPVDLPLVFYLNCYY